MLDQVKLENILFLDIETVPQKPSYDNLTETERELWDRKAGYLKKEEPDTPSSLYPRSAIYAEFGKIVCITTGFMTFMGDGRQFRVKSFFGDDEKQVLAEFKALLDKHFNGPRHLLCAHNGKEFDFPYMARRMLVHGIGLPRALDIAGKKPWEVPHLDTMELWKFGDFKNFTPLNLLAAIFGIRSPKDDIDGSMVWFVYWKEKNLERIVNYCQKDVVTVAQILLKMKGDALLRDEEVTVV
jgi:uncharacterized protein YprB with RNaseH-like and TPR domain